MWKSENADYPDFPFPHFPINPTIRLNTFTTLDRTASRRSARAPGAPRAGVIASRKTRGRVIASYASATAMMRAPSATSLAQRAVGIPEAVDALLRVADEIGRGLEVRHLADQIGGDLRVRMDQTAAPRGQRRRLAQHRLRHRELADDRAAAPRARARPCRRRRAPWRSLRSPPAPPRDRRAHTASRSERVSTVSRPSRAASQSIVRDGERVAQPLRRGRPPPRRAPRASAATRGRRCAIRRPRRTDSRSRSRPNGFVR